MKIITLLLSVCCLTVTSQTLTQSFNEPKVGDLESAFTLDTSAFSGPIPKQAGSGISWDYSKLKTVGAMNTASYVAVSTVTDSAKYPNSNLVQQQAFLNTFLKSATTPTTQTEVHGLTSPSLNLVFSDPAVMIKYPFSFGGSITDNIAGTFSGFSFTGSCTGKILTNADATGTLTLPGGLMLSNVLRVKSVQTLTLTSGFFPLGTARQTIYNYYHGSQKFAVLSLNYTELTLIGGTPSVTGVANGSSAFFVGLNENKADEILSAVIYPNPANDVLYLKQVAGTKPEFILITDITGREVLSFPFHEQLSIAHLQEGIYVVSLSRNGVSKRKKLVIER
jgi:hypothetical protein